LWALIAEFKKQNKKVFLWMRIRNATKDDLRSFVEIYREAYEGLEEYAYTTNREIKSYFRWLMGRDANGFFLAEINSPIGFIACDTNWIDFEMNEVGEIHELFVHPDWMRRGVGRALLMSGLSYIKSRGRSIAKLWVGVTNLKARRFYKRIGFREEGSWGRWVRMVLEL
jgi:ribosomal protein S18 acetylase RimI-like enzyme